MLFPSLYISKCMNTSSNLKLNNSSLLTSTEYVPGFIKSPRPNLPLSPIMYFPQALLLSDIISLVVLLITFTTISSLDERSRFNSSPNLNSSFRGQKVFSLILVIVVSSLLFICIISLL